MEELVAASMAHGLLPKVVPEFRRITVGGAIMGGAMESSSFLHGMFHDTIKSCELLLPNGTIVVASRSVNADLLAGVGGSYGTLASLTLATVECVRLPTGGTASPPRAALTLEWHTDVDEGVAALSAMAHAHTRPDGRCIDFLDAAALPKIASSSTDGSIGGVLVCTACLVDEGGAADEAPTEAWSVGEAGDAFYFEKLLGVRTRLAAAGSSSGATINVSMGVEDYVFRFDRGAFQIADTMYKRLHLAPPEAIASRMVLQDLFAPEERAAAAIAFCQERLTEPPCALWLWPVRGSESPALLAPNGHVRSTEVLMNIGIYSRAPSCATGGGVDFTRALEQWGLANGCRKLLYSSNHYEDSELWATDATPHMYDRPGYDALRERTGASGQPRLEERVVSALRPAHDMSLRAAASVTLIEWLL